MAACRPAAIISLELTIDASGQARRLADTHRLDTHRALSEGRPPASHADPTRRADSAS